MKIIHILGMLLVALVVKAASPIEGLLERIDKGASRKFMIEQVKSPVDFFELDQKGDKVVTSSVEKPTMAFSGVLIS